MKRTGSLFEQIISHENLERAIIEVNKTHRWHPGHNVNNRTAWVESTMPYRIEELREIITNGFAPTPPRVTERYDESAQKMRTISEPIQWPDQYVHHALIQVLEPVLLKKMDYYCCGSIKERGTKRARIAVQSWVCNDKKNTRYCVECDIRHFYDSIQPKYIKERMLEIIKDHKTLDLVERIIADGIHIGAYTSQWFANTLLQPLDKMIRENDYAKYYVRYMDNLTIFGSNKRKLHMLIIDIELWLNAHGLELKDNWQLFPINDENRNGREPSAVGYRYGRTYTLIRKHNLQRIKRAIKWFENMEEGNKYISAEEASGILSRLGQLIHCNNTNIYHELFHGEKIIRKLKNIIRREHQKYDLKWDEYMKEYNIKNYARHLADDIKKFPNLKVEPF